MGVRVCIYPPQVQGASLALDPSGFMSNRRHVQHVTDFPSIKNLRAGPINHGLSRSESKPYPRCMIGTTAHGGYIGECLRWNCTLSSFSLPCSDMIRVILRLAQQHVYVVPNSYITDSETIRHTLPAVNPPKSGPGESLRRVPPSL